MKRIFISSVQREFAEIRKLLKRYIARNPAYRRLFDTFVFEEGMSPTSVFTHLRLFAADGGITNAAMLLFGKDPQRFMLSSEVKCVQWYGVERHKPMLSYQIFRGTLFDMADEATAFVLSKLDLRNGTRANGTTAPREYEIPQSVIAEAIINAIAHRDYVSMGSVQVEVFSDRVVVRNPGHINPALTKADLYVEHSSYPNNPKIAEALYQTKHIEKFGTGFTDLVADCRTVGLPEPTIDDSRTEFVITIYRSTNKSQITTNKSQINDEVLRTKGNVTKIVKNVRDNPKITIAEQSRALGLSENKVRTIISKLREYGILMRIGARKNGQWVVASWVNDEVLEIEDRELQPVRVTEDGTVEVFFSLDLEPNSELHAKLEKLSRETGKPMEYLVREILERAVEQDHGEKNS